MKFALSFLCALVAISHQQFQRPREVNWLAPYYLTRQPVIKAFHPQYYNDANDETPFFRNLRIMYPQDELYGSYSQYNMDDNDYADPQARFKGFYQPLISQNPRFFFGTSGIVNPFLKTATFTLTSTVNVTSVQVCIPEAQFAAGLTNACRRKKRQILDSFETLDSEYAQFPVTPSKIQQVIPSATASLLQENHELESQTDGRDHGIISSKDEIVLDDLSQNKNLRERRLFLNIQVITTTVTQYSFFSTTSLRSVSLLADADAGKLKCLPPGAIVCPAAAG